MFPRGEDQHLPTPCGRWEEGGGCRLFAALWGGAAAHQEQDLLCLWAPLAYIILRGTHPEKSSEARTVTSMKLFTQTYLPEPMPSPRVLGILSASLSTSVCIAFFYHEE